MVVKRKSYYPVHLDLAGKRCVVIGGGDVAERKINSLLACHAEVVVVSPSVTRRIAGLARRGRISLNKKFYEPRLLRGAYLVIAATDEAAVNRKVARDAAGISALVNAVDLPEESSFIVPAVLRRGHLSLSIATDGASPLLSRLLKERCSTCIGHEYAELVRILGAARKKAKKCSAETHVRASLYESIISSPILELLKGGRDKEARLLVKEIMDEHLSIDPERAATGGKG